MLKIITKNTDVTTLLEQATTCLEKYGRDGVPENIKGQATLSCIKAFLHRDYFSVCAVTELAKSNQVIIDSEHMNLFRTLHCVNWSDIHPDTREYVTALLVDYFKGNIVMSNVAYG